MLTYDLTKKKIGGYFDGLTYKEQMTFNSDDEFNGWYKALKEMPIAFIGWEIVEYKHIDIENEVQ